MSRMRECSQIIHSTVEVLLRQMPNHQYTYLLCLNWCSVGASFWLRRPLFFVFFLSNRMIITITRIESTCFNRRANTGRVVHKTRNRLSVTESQSNNLTLVHKTQRSTSVTLSWLNKFCQIRRSQTIDAFKNNYPHLEGDSALNWQLMQLLQYWCDVVMFTGACY